MLGPVDAFIFTDPCYLIYAVDSRFSRASITFNNGGVFTTVTLNSDTFTRVSGTCFSVTISREAGEPKDYPVNSILEVGPNAWGILQPIDGGLLGIGLALEQNGQDINATFINPTPLQPGTLGATLTDPFPTQIVSIRNGGVNNGVSDMSLVSALYILLGGRVLATPPVPAGQQSGPLLTANIDGFDLSLTGSPTVRWSPVENVVMEPGMSLVVTGTYAQPALAIMVPVGPVKIVALTKVEVASP